MNEIFCIRVNKSNLKIAVADAESVIRSRNNFEISIGHSLTQEKLNGSETEVSPVVYLTNMASILIRLWLKEKPFTGRVNGSRRFHIQSAVRADLVVLPSPTGKMFFGIFQIKKRLTQKFSLHSAVESFNFALRLWMHNSAMDR